MGYTHVITDPKASDLADQALAAVGVNFSRGTTPDDEVYAIRYALTHYTPDNGSQYTPEEAAFMLDIVGHIVTSPRRHGFEHTD